MRLVYCILLLGLGALAAQICDATASAMAIRARAELNSGRPLDALATARAASAIYPWQPEAAFTRLVALERMQGWKEMLGADRVALWHTYPAAVLALLGEAQARTGDSRAAAATLWNAFMRAPRPRDNPAQLWRLAMLEGAQAWGVSDPRVQFAARRTLEMIPVDRHISPEDAAAAAREARAILGRR